MPEAYAVPDLCSAEYWVIECGPLCAKDHPLIAEVQGEMYLYADMAAALAGTLRCCSVLSWSSG